MQANREDRVSGDGARERNRTQTIITALAAIVLAAGAYFLMPKDEPEPPPEIEAPDEPLPAPVKPTPTPAETIAAAPDIPEPAPVEPQEEPPAEPEIDEPEPEPAPAPPTPEELDAEFREALTQNQLSAPRALASAAAAPYLLDRSVASLDQMARGLVPGRTSNIARPAGKFAVRRDGTRYSVEPAGYARYDSLVNAITGLDEQKIASFFTANRSRLEDAYAALGYPRDAMDNTLIAALDQVLAAPIIDTPPELISRGALWAYADEALEQSSDLNKQLLRTGPENLRKLQAWAQSLRDALLQP